MVVKPLKRVIIKEELVELTGDYRPAIILNQFIYWSERMYDTDKYIREEKERAIRHQMEVSIDESTGWIYKTAEELNDELMVGMSLPTIRKYIKQLVASGYLMERRNPKYKWDKTLQYRVDLYKIQKDLGALGYALEGYKLLPNITIYEGLEKVIYTDNLEDIEYNKIDLPAPTDKSIKIDNDKNKFVDDSIPQNVGKENPKIDFVEIAYDRCLKEIDGFEYMESHRKDFYVNMMLRKIAIGE